MRLQAGIPSRAARPLAFSLFVSALSLTGCGIGTVNTSVPEHPLAIRGVVHGGQSPVSGSTIALYRVGNAGLGSAAVNVLTQPVSTNADGSFALTGLFSCTNATDQMYIAATGGNPGLSAGTNNARLAMVAALGDCGNLNANSSIQINEVTTVAAAYALTQFSHGPAKIGATSTNAVGMQNAMRNAALIADSSTGNIATLPSTQTVESQKVLALADVLATCVNSDGGSPCDTLFGLETFNGAVPADTYSAAVAIAQNPSVSVPDLFNLIAAQAPFPTALAAAPNDWTVSLTLTGGGIYSPTALGIDSKGYVWVADYNGGLTGYTPQGAPLTLNAYANYPTPWLSEVYGLAVDINDDVWLTNEETPRHGTSYGTLVKFSGVASGTPGTPVNWYYDNTINYPKSVAADSNGYIDVANYSGSSYTIYNTSGALVAGGLGANTVIALPSAIHPDADHGVWLANSSGNTAPHFSYSNGTATLIANPACCSGANGVAVDSQGNGWISDYLNSSISEVSSTGTVLQKFIGANAGVYTPVGVFVDGAQNVWVPNYHGVGNGVTNSSISEIAGNTQTLVAAGSPLTPSTGLGLDANLVEPFAAQADASGNLWVSSHGNDRVVMFFGLAAPTRTPIFATPLLP